MKEFRNKRIAKSKKEMGYLPSLKKELVTSSMILYKRDTNKIFVKQTLRPSDKKKVLEQLFNQARECASILYKLGAKRVWLFGSLAELDENKISERTDIDLAVDNMNYKKYLAAKSMIKNTTDFKVDVILLDRTNPGFRSEIINKRIFLGK